MSALRAQVMDLPSLFLFVHLLLCLQFPFRPSSGWKASLLIRPRPFSWARPFSGTCRPAVTTGRPALDAISMPAPTAAPSPQISPGQPGGDNNFQVGGAPNYRLNPGSPDAGFGGFHDGDYPFHKLADVDQGLTLISDMNDVTGSQGVFATTHDQIVVGSRPALVTTTDTNSENDAGITRAPNGQLGPLIRVPVPKLPPHPPQPGVPPPTSAGSVELTTSVADPVFSFPDPGDPGKRINTRKNRSVSLRCCESGEFCCQRGECNSER